MANGAFFRAQGQSQVKLRKVKALIPENEVFDYELQRLEELADHAPFFQVNRNYFVILIDTF